MSLRRERRAHTTRALARRQLVAICILFPFTVPRAGNRDARERASCGYKTYMFDDSVRILKHEISSTCLDRA